ncbi:MAG TPA: class I SAM-dependent methyltransferase, partial [Anaerolineales bacterium]|nr:class I SAM-dependent methyltransferase [Anaerolineales bacterium]
MTRTAVNYDQIAPTNNCRFQGEKSQPILDALRSLARQIHAGAVLEAGCGTGFWLAGLEVAFAKQAGQKFFGLDRSIGMLRQASLRKHGFYLVQGQAEAFPFSESSFDLIYCVHALHHFSNQPEFITSCLR